jgi:hypothetical protein
MDKLERDGKVAVLVSSGFGAGWSTWNCDAEGAAFNKRIALAVLGESGETPIQAAEAEYPDAYHGGICDLEVAWVTKGDRFEINEYDGSESLRVFGPDDGYVA